MNTDAGLERCLTFINCQLQPARPGTLGRESGRYRAVTISRQSGSGGHSVATHLAELLQMRSPKTSAPWTVFDRELVERVLQEHHLPSRMARFMPEDRISEVSDTIDELFGLHPPSWTLVRKTADTILRLVQLGNVILIGRGAAVITARYEYVFHVRLVASVERRIKLMQELNHLSPAAARSRVGTEDVGRRRFLKKYFNREIDDPLLYHLVINTDLVPPPEAARLIADAMVPAEHHSLHVPPQPE